MSSGPSPSSIAVVVGVGIDSVSMGHRSRSENQCSQTLGRSTAMPFTLLMTSMVSFRDSDDGYGTSADAARTISTNLGIHASVRRALPLHGCNAEIARPNCAATSLRNSDRRVSRPGIAARRTDLPRSWISQMRCVYDPRFDWKVRRSCGLPDDGGRNARKRNRHRRSTNASPEN